MKRVVRLFLLICIVCAVRTAAQNAELRIGRLTGGLQPFALSYSGALQSLLQHVRETTFANIVPEPVDIRDFTDERLFSLPFIYANFADRNDWTFSDDERRNLKAYLERGGFLFIDAGITASFLRGVQGAGQHHSYAEWDATPELKEAFKAIFPEASFQVLKRSDPLFKAFYSGLPDTSLLPDSVRSYTEQEKWPDGTYSTVVLKIDGRVAVMTTPIIAMGWKKSATGQWLNRIQFRILEDTQGLTEYVSNASYSGERFEATREDGGKDVIYCQSAATPSWNHEPSGKTRIFRYYSSPEISDFAHEFYTRLGTNIVVYALAR